MFDNNSRWFEESSIASSAKYMVKQTAVSPDPETDTSQERRTNQLKATLFAFLGSICFLGVIVGMLAAFAEPVPGKEPDYVMFGVLCFCVVAGATGITYAVSGTNNSKRAERESAIRNLCERASGFHFCGRREFDEKHVGTLPWFISEEWINTFGLMIGKLRTSKFCLLECNHVIDPMMATTDSKLAQGAMLVGKHKRLFRREFEAIAFTEKLANVPDLLIVPKRDPSRAYFRRALDGQRCDVSDFYDLPKEITKKYWIASADPQSCGEHLTGELLSILASKKWCTVQVVGGHCCVMTAQWHGNQPTSAPGSETEIADNIKLAGKIFELLKADDGALHDSDIEDGLASWESSYNSVESAGGVATMAAPGTQQRAHATDVDEFISPDRVPPKTTGHRRHSIVMLLVLFGFGAPLAAIGGLCAALGIVDLNRAASSTDWPQVNGVVKYSSIDTTTVKRRGKEIGQHRPEIRYEYTVNGTNYTNDQIAFGPRSRTEDKTEVETLLAKYPVDGQAAIYYDPDKPSVSTLKPGPNEATNAKATVGVCAGMFGFGMLLCYYGASGRKAKS